ncbi:MAG: hypothetical protein GY705_07750 [Bacteroidetes bacterium]|nr:hypothetical protein [Bacteroidota bacterium]
MILFVVGCQLVSHQSISHQLAMCFAIEAVIEVEVAIDIAIAIEVAIDIEVEN